MSGAVLRGRCGTTIPLDVERWRAPADPIEEVLIAALPDTVLDIGCGPGRIVEAAARSGRRALGIDPSGAATREAGRRGVPVLRRSVFDALPGEGRWGAALLLDGNVGIGGDPLRLLQRARDLLHPDGVLVAEVEPPGTPTTSLRVRLERATADRQTTTPSPWFPWARVGADDMARLLGGSGLRLDGLTCVGHRWLAHGVRA